MMRLAPVFLFALLACADGEEQPAPQKGPKKGPQQGPQQEEEEKAPQIDVGAVLRRSKEFKRKLEKFEIAYDHEKQLVRAVGSIAYRGGGPCEFLATVYPAKSHETIVLLDNGVWDGPGRRDTRALRGLATTLNNAFLAAGFPRGRPFDWDRNTGEVFMPKGVPVWIYAEYVDERGEKPETKRALLSEWLWNYKTLRVMAPKKFVYTGSLMVDLGPPDHEKAFGAELDRLLVAVLNTRTALIDNTEEGSLENGAYEALHQRVPPIGTRVTVLFSLKKLPAMEHPPLELSKELLAERARRDAERKAAKKAGEDVPVEYRPPEGVGGAAKRADGEDEDEDDGGGEDGEK